MSHETFPTEEKKDIPSIEANINEKSAYFDLHPEDIRPDDLNNFYLFLPGSKYLKQVEKYLSPESIRRRDAIAKVLEKMPEVQRAIENFKEHPHPNSNPHDINDALIPLYVALRKEGFSHYELVQ